MEMKIELIAVPVSDVDRSKEFYGEVLGFEREHDHLLGEEIRFVQLTPPGSAASIAIGTGITELKPGEGAPITLVVDGEEIEAIRAELAARGLEITEVQEMPWGARHAFFADPDGNAWTLQAPSKVAPNDR